MTETTLSPVRSWTDWLHIRRLYRRAFPVTERKPFAIIRRMHRKGLTDVWCIRHGGDFAGFAATINGSPDAQGKRLILLDYLAVAPPLRGRGTGSAALQLLSARYAADGVFVEIESPFEPGDDQPQRLRRRAFYERCGYAPSRTMASVFGVPMELLCLRCTLDVDAYHDFYCTRYSPWAGEHIHPLPYPQETKQP